MAEYKCKKCGLTGFSKNIRTRNLFTQDQLASIMTNIANVVTTVNDKGRRVVTLEFPYCDTKPELSDDELEMRVVKDLQDLSDDTIEHWLC